MLSILALIAAVTSESPAPVEEVQAAIWYDLEVNAMIGNSNWIASLWYNAGSDETANLHIRDLSCRHHGGGYRCSFTLFRDGGVATTLGEEAPDMLTCEADLMRVKGEDDKIELGVKHLPPLPRGGHSRTTMHCKDARKA
ncbi:MAG: hypothetical protein JWN66_4508 [Sphingomonas bacterium]|uniref:hypothetical protein n=1 Tax=Sphingomonas bacterium TaxID=1895847 RepID=UPI00260C9BC4|nr:hypothetical protein [Sphingomonas bacterium]MDB5707392.1 hypothetical protein [Sphingomonas bacterium]